MFVNKATGSVLAMLFVSMLIALAYVGSTFFTRELQFEHLREQQRSMQIELESLRAEHRVLEHRFVKLATHVENMEDTR